MMPYVYYIRGNAWFAETTKILTPVCLQAAMSVIGTPHRDRIIIARWFTADPQSMCSCSLRSDSNSRQ